MYLFDVDVNSTHTAREPYWSSALTYFFHYNSVFPLRFANITSLYLLHLVRDATFFLLYQSLQTPDAIPYSTLLPYITTPPTPLLSSQYSAVSLAYPSSARLPTDPSLTTPLSPLQYRAYSSPSHTPFDWACLSLSRTFAAEHQTRKRGGQWCQKLGS